MKKTLYCLLVLLVAIPAAFAQEKPSKLTNHLTPYGFFRTFAIFDSRQNQAGLEDLFYYLPLDKNNDPLTGRDMNANPSFKLLSITTRLGFDMSGYQFGSTKVTGKLEVDFYLMNGSAASLRLRQAYVKLLWDGLGYADNTISLTVGQAWNPMSADKPYSVNLESGTPFNPFSRSPQVMMDAILGKNFVLTAGAIYPMQYRPTGPEGASENYIKYGMIPELYAGVTFRGGDFLARLGADFISIKPRWRRVKDRISFITPMLYLQYSYENLKVNAKTLLASGGDHLCLMNGYALYDYSDPDRYLYTPLRSSSSYFSFSYGKKWQLLCMVGYIKALGAARPLELAESGTYKGYVDPADIHYLTRGFKNIDQLMRVTPTLAYNAGKLTVALEYNATYVEYGDLTKIGANGLSTVKPHGILNHRLLGVLKFNL